MDAVSALVRAGGVAAHETIRTAIARLATGVADRAEHTRVGMALTLDRLAATAETGSGGGSDRP